MAGQVLDTLFVDLVARGVEEAGRAMKNISQASEKATASTRKLRDTIQEVGQAGRGVAGTLERGGGGFSDMRMSGAKASIGSSTGFISGEHSSGVDLKKTLGGLKNAFGQLTVAVAPLAAMIAVGLQGTVELERFSRAMSQISREVANLVAVPMRMLGDALLSGIHLFQQLGPAGQKLLGIFTGVGVLAIALSDPGMKSALKELGAAFGELLLASRPLINQLAYLGTTLIRVGLVEPLKVFVTVLTAATLALTKISEAAAKGMRLFGLGFTMRGGGQRDELRLNQTGTEDAQSTFNRIQEAVLRAGGGEQTEDEKQTGYLQNISNGVDIICDFINSGKMKFKEDVDRIANSPPARFAEGAVDSSFGIGGLILGGLMKKMRK